VTTNTTGQTAAVSVAIVGMGPAVERAMARVIKCMILKLREMSVVILVIKEISALPVSVYVCVVIFLFLILLNVGFPLLISLPV
jgi:hypothetical protein